MVYIAYAEHSKNASKMVPNSGIGFSLIIFFSTNETLKSTCVSALQM